MKPFREHQFAAAPGALARRMYWAPVVGIGVFAALYVLAAQRYPGGSQAEPAVTGFSWLHNYWCNLLNERALNGAPNPARAVALTAMGVLGLSLTLFWWQLPAWLPFGPRGAALVRGTGTLTLLAAGFLATAYHDVATMMASVWGLFTLGATFWGLHQRRARSLVGWGAACAGLIAANNVIYYTGYALWFLPLLQKITTVGVLGWIVWMALALHPKSRPPEARHQQTKAGPLAGN